MGKKTMRPYDDYQDGYAEGIAYAREHTWERTATEHTIAFDRTGTEYPTEQTFKLPLCSS